MCSKWQPSCLSPRADLTTGTHCCVDSYPLKLPLRLGLVLQVTYSNSQFTVTSPCHIPELSKVIQCDVNHSSITLRSQKHSCATWALLFTPFEFMQCMKIRLHGYVTVFSTSNPIELQILSTDGPSHSSAYRLFLHVQFNISLREVRQSGACLKFPTGKAEIGRTQVPGWPTWANNEMLSQEVTKKKKSLHGKTFYFSLNPSCRAFFTQLIPHSIPCQK